MRCNAGIVTAVPGSVVTRPPLSSGTACGWEILSRSEDLQAQEATLLAHPVATSSGMDEPGPDIVEPVRLVVRS